MSTANLPATVRGLFPKENLAFAEGINEKDAIVLKKVFKNHDCFERVGEMIDEVENESADLGSRMRAVLESNKARLVGLSPAAVEFSKKLCIMYSNQFSSIIFFFHF
uniref:FH2 domain-containing protein n=1 Tax=Heterorhabditis bacteriophora TaxID=37862 RepID=A0A1I7XTR3_HETBA